MGTSVQIPPAAQALMPPLRFLQTGDWHLGQPYRGLEPDVADRLRAARIEAVASVLDAAKRRGIAMVLATGDQFDGPHVAPDLVRAMLDHIAARPDLTVHMIPGNHDPCEPGSIYTRAGFCMPENLHLHREACSIPLPEFDATLYPCPCTSRYGGDPMAWIPPRAPGDGLRIALAHGSRPQFGGAEARNHPIPDDAPTRYDLDYVALGDWHTASPWPEEHPGERMYYAGAPEVGGWDETRAGTALEIALTAEAPPHVELIRVGRFTWLGGEPELFGPADLRELLAWLDGLDAPSTLLRLAPRGVLAGDDLAELECAIADRRARFALIEFDPGAVRVADAGEIELPRDPLLRAAHDRLLQWMEDPSRPPPSGYPDQARGLDPEIVQRALTHFRHLLPRRGDG